MPVARAAPAGAALAPEWFTIAPVEAIRKVLKQTDLSINDIDLFEINEAFAAQVLACQQSLNIPPDRLNAWGGAIALGHPIGCTGTRITVTAGSGRQQRAVGD